MFTVYGVSGRMFRGSIEQLRQVGGVSALSRTKAIVALKRDGQGPQSASPDAVSGSAHRAPSDEAHRSALAAYTQTQQVGSERHPLSQVQDLMSRAVVTVTDTATVMQAWQLLAKQGLGQAPVVNADGILVGLLSRANLLHPDHWPAPEGLVPELRPALAHSVADIMHTPVPSVAPDTDIRRVARVLLDTGLPGLPVVDDQDAVIGFISRSDILRAVVTDPPLDLWG